jgi:uncharacterized protein YbcI
MDKKKSKKIVEKKSTIENKGGLITKENFDLSALNKKELRYFKQMYPCSGVPMLLSEPGFAKSAIIRSIANKVKVPVYGNLQYIDLRLSYLDETDIGLYPNKFQYKYTITLPDGKTEEHTEYYLEHIVPKWAYMANSRPTIIHFEELNRALLSVRNAALQILLERCIGYEFKLNDTVYLIASGNLGNADGTDVEEFDRALKGRIISIRHKLTLGEWKEYFANDNIHPMLLNFISNNENFYYTDKSRASEEEYSYASPRSWTFLSDYIQKNYSYKISEDSNSKFIPFDDEVLEDLREVAFDYVGAQPSKQLINWIDDIMKISIKDIIEKYSILKTENNIEFTRSKKSELMQSLRSENLMNLKDYQIENIKLFLLDINPDEATAFIIHMLDNELKNEKEEQLSDCDEVKQNFVIDFMSDPRLKQFSNKISNTIDEMTDSLTSAENVENF